MAENKLTDKEIIKALEEWRKEIIDDYQRLQLLGAPMDCFEESHADTVTKLSNALDLINRLETENENYSHNIKKLTATNHQLYKEVKRLHNVFEKMCDKYKNIRLETIDEAVNWLLSLFQRNEDGIHLSRAAILHWYGHQHTSFEQYIDRALSSVYTERNGG